MSIKQQAGRPVELLRYTEKDSNGNYCGEKKPTGEKGFLMQWGVTYNVVVKMTYTVGIVELDNGEVESVLPEFLRFLDHVEVIWSDEEISVVGDSVT